MTWLVFGWCMAHKLELEIQDAMKGTYFNQVDEMLLRIYYLYKRSPKKLRELAEIHDLVKQSIEFDASGVKPIKASGTRWIAHKIGALKKLLDKYSIYILHLENLCSDKSYPEKDRAKFKGYLKQWQSTKMLLHIAFYIDVLEPVKILSLSLQKKEVDPVNSSNALLKTKSKFIKLEQKLVELYPSIAFDKKYYRK